MCVSWHPTGNVLTKNPSDTFPIRKWEPSPIFHQTYHRIWRRRNARNGLFGILKNIWCPAPIKSIFLPTATTSVPIVLAMARIADSYFLYFEKSAFSILPVSKKAGWKAKTEYKSWGIWPFTPRFKYSCPTMDESIGCAQFLDNFLARRRGPLPT